MIGHRRRRSAVWGVWCEEGMAGMEMQTIACNRMPNKRANKRIYYRLYSLSCGGYVDIYLFAAVFRHAIILSQHLHLYAHSVRVLYVFRSHKITIRLFRLFVRLHHYYYYLLFSFRGRADSCESDEIIVLPICRRCCYCCGHTCVYVRDRIHALRCAGCKWNLLYANAP